jgi:predicted regulator of amino acid metabolism with ACT domain
LVNKQELSTMINDISPIAHAIELSQKYDNSRFTNILSSNRTSKEIPEDSSFLISDRSIKIDKIPDDQRIKQYQDKVLTAISDSAKKK